MTLVGLQTHKAQPGRVGDRTRHRQRRLSRPGSAASHPNVDLDQDSEFDAGGRSGRRQVSDVDNVVDGHHDVGSAAKLHQAANLDRPDDLVGDQDVGDTTICEYLGFTELRACDADGPGGQLR